MKDKINYKKEYEFANIFKKISKYFLDALFMLLVSVVINFASIDILNNVEPYKETKIQLNQNVDEIYSIENDAKLADYISLDNKDTQEPISRADMLKKYLSRQLSLSIALDDGDQFKLNNITSYEDKYGSANIDNDYLAHFYLVYIKNNPGLVDVPSNDYFKYFFNTVLNTKETTNYYKYRDNDIPYLTSDIGYKLYSYYINKENNDIGKTIYDNIYQKFNTTLDSSINVLYLKDTNFKNNYNLYKANYNQLTIYSIITLFISYSISFLILFIIIPLFFKKKDISSFILKLELRSMKENEKVKTYQYLLNRLVLFITLFWIILLASLFNIGFSGLSITLFNIGSLNINLLYFVFLSMIISIISLIGGIINKERRLLSELVSSSIYLSYKKSRTYSYENSIEELNKITKN